MSRLYDRLYRAIQTCPLTENEFIPLDTLHNEITWPAVKELLPDTFRRRWLSCWDCILEHKIPGARKVIAILELIGQSDTIEILLLEELTDEDLPLSRKGVNLQSNCGEKAFKSFGTWKPGLVDAFLTKQWMVIEPPLKFDANHAINIELDKYCVLQLAFSSCDEVPKTKASTAHVYEGALRPRRQHGLDNGVS
jgi:hypothetical protein